MLTAAIFFILTSIFISVIELFVSAKFFKVSVLRDIKKKRDFDELEVL